MTSNTDDAVELPILEPLEPDGEPAAEDFSNLIRSFEDGADLDDSAALDLDPGITLPDGESSEDQGPDLSLDLGDLLSTDDDAEETLFASPGEEFGPAGDFPRSDVRDDEEFDGSDESEGSPSVESLLLEDLPELDGDPDADLEGSASDNENPLAGAEETLEEDPPGRAELPWVAIPVAAVSRPTQILAIASGSVVVAGPDIVRITAEDVAEPLAQGFGGTVSLVLDGDRKTLVVATASGELFRLGLQPLSAAPEQLRFRHAEAAASRSTPDALRVAGPTPSGRPAILLHVSTPSGGTLFESTDRGTTWRRIELGGRVTALSIGSPPVCLVETADSLRLYRSSPSGGFSPIGAEWTLDADRAELSSNGEVVAALEHGAGIQVSADGGATFRRAPGTARATVVTTGWLGVRASAFAALYDPNSGRAALVWIDAASALAQIIAEVLPSASEDDDDDWARVTSIAWSPETETLWVAGKFGLARWRRLPSA